MNITTHLLIYDLEICNAIPPRDSQEWVKDISYCKGWEDFKGMGISAISWCLVDAESLETIEMSVSQLTHAAWKRLSKFNSDPAIKIGGFNSLKFDDRLLQAYGLQVTSDFDILQLILEAAGLKGQEYWKQGLRYNLAGIATANGLQKSGSGELAPILHQRSKFSELMAYCLNDSMVETDILVKLLKGILVDPNTGLVLGLGGRGGLP
jgi:hypothetical protein